MNCLDKNVARGHIYTQKMVFVILFLSIIAGVADGQYFQLTIQDTTTGKHTQRHMNVVDVLRCVFSFPRNLILTQDNFSHTHVQGRIQRSVMGVGLSLRMQITPKIKQIF